jgi:hypothetical protein
MQNVFRGIGVNLWIGGHLGDPSKFAKTLGKWPRARRYTIKYMWIHGHVYVNT